MLENPMGIFPYLVFLVPSTAVALVLRTFLRWLTASWQPPTALHWQNVLRAILRGLPYALAFTPTLLMKRGLGVLIPASVHLCGALYEMGFGSHARDAEDARNVTNSAMLLLVVWGVLAFIFFAMQTSALDRKKDNGSKAPC